MAIWNVMELCKAQLQDVDPNDVLCGGLYRKCNTYKSGGGYDKFPSIYERRFGKVEKDLSTQFVVQLRGCPLKCPYCYVTNEGVWGKDFHKISTEKLIEDFNSSGCNVFHLMGGAPAYYMVQWEDIIDNLGDNIFHSDLLLMEGYYSPDIVRSLAKKENCLYAISVKGGTPQEFYQNTGIEFNGRMFWYNLYLLVEAGFPFYFTFTGMTSDTIQRFKNVVVQKYEATDLLQDSFSIDIVDYKALHYKE